MCVFVCLTTSEEDRKFWIPVRLVEKRRLFAFSSARRGKNVTVVIENLETSSVCAV